MPSKPDNVSTVISLAAEPNEAEAVRAMPTMSRIFRLFVSSTFQDLSAERNALHASVFPRLRELCRRHDCRFQAIDLRWGVSEQAGLDQQTMTICLGEIERCHRVTPRPNFLVLLGDRYGWRPPPPCIAASEFDKLLANVSEDEVEMVHCTDKRHDERNGWYRRDENAKPIEYRLRPRHVDLSGCETRDQIKDTRQAEAATWAKIEARLQRALERAACKASLPAEKLLMYETSATEQEIAVGALQVDHPEDKVFCFFRSLRGLPDGFRPREFLDFVQGRCEAGGRVLSSEAIKCLKSVRRLPDDACARRVRDLIIEAWEEMPKGYDATADLILLDAWLGDATAFYYRDLDDDWRSDRGANARLTALKERLRQCIPDNVVECGARWTDRGPSTNHLGTLPQDLDQCLKLLDAPEPPETLCATVWRWLAGTILREIERPTPLPVAPDVKLHVLPDDGLDPEGRAHCDFANGLLRFFVGRLDPLRAIRGYLNGEERRTLAVVAEGGTGKSALMAKALLEAKKAQPDAHIVYRFIGATPSSSDGRSLLVSLCQEITRRYGEDQALPFEYTELASELERRMKLATSDRPLVLFLDALDQLSEANGARSLTWLPRELPDGVRIVVSTRREDDMLAAMTHLEPQEVVLGPMSRQDGEALVNLWLEDAGRTLRPDQRNRVLDAFEHERSGGRPLYLKLAFEEARRWTSYDPQEALEPGIPGIIQKNLFDRLAREENHGQELVARTVGYLAASRDGLAEDELLDVLSRDPDLYASFLKGSYHVPFDLVTHAIAYRRSNRATGGEATAEEAQSAETWLREVVANPECAAELRSFFDEALKKRDGPRLPVVLWSRLFLDLAPYLTERLSRGTSLLAFYHRELRDVAARVFLRGERGRVLHSRLADYWRFRADSERDRSWAGGDVRGLSELPYHLTEAERWPELYDTLTDFRFLEHKATEVGVEVSDGDAEAVYTGVFDLQQDFDHALRRIPGGDSRTGADRPLIVTVVNFGNGQVVRCPWCNTLHAVTEELQRKWLGQSITCPNKDCGGPLRLNPFVAEGSRGSTSSSATGR